MEFKRKKKRGVNRKVCRVWLNTEGYRIIWRKEVFGVSVPARYQACVRTIVPGCFEEGSTEMWDFVNPKKRLYRSIKAAVADCERHQRRWARITRCTGIRVVRDLFGGREPRGIPKWVVPLLDCRLFEMFMNARPKRSRNDDENFEPSIESEAPKKRRPRKMRSDKGKKRGPRKGAKK